MDSTNKEHEYIELVKIAIKDIRKVLRQNKALYPLDMDDDVPERILMKRMIEELKQVLKMYI